MIIQFRCFQDYQSLLSCGDYQCLSLFIFSKTIRVFRQDFKCLPYLARLQGLLLIYLIPLMLFLLEGFTDWASARGRSDAEIARMKLVSLYLLPFYLQ